jgi:type VI secretion system protein
MRGLLEKIGRGTRFRGTDDPSTAVGDHLRALLNTRQGSAPAAPGYGMVDFTDLLHTFPKGIPTLASAIRATILQYEPRLKNVSVRHVPDDDPSLLKFEIVAQLADGSRATLKFRTEVSPSGQVAVH